MALGWSDYLDMVVPFGLLLMASYHGYLYYKVKTDPSSTVIGINHKARRAWVHSIMQDNPGRTVLAVQTLRNSIMVSTLMATAAILITCGLAAVLSSTYKIKEPLANVILGPQNDVMVTAKFMSLCGCFIFAFLCYTQSIRFTNHVNYLINVPVADFAGVTTPDYVADVLARACNFYTVGTRSFYLGFPMLLWIFNPIPVLVCSAALLPFLYHFDFVRGGRGCGILLKGDQMQTKVACNTDRRFDEDYMYEI
eukprot:TRINITY_DN4292_c0_g1_i1.p1 TRINITY_DN4292_c0_g1~~TRINITY_DN4292_c0_g1_i1.p1  ORF type:complete len:252 (-),score=18.40 TRINITY_DN4292_c0_g1_i1:346-1101(-)